MLNKSKEWIINFLAKEDSTYHILTFIISSILVSSFPIVWFIVFMKEKMIFSYDFFTNGMFGLSIFFFISLFFLLVLGFILVGSIAFITIYLYKKKKEPSHDSKYIGIILLLINIVALYTYYINIQKPIGYDTFWFIVIFNLILFIHLGISLAGAGIHKFLSLFVFIFVFIYATSNYHHILSSFVETGLLQFRMGGDIPTKIIDGTKNTPIAKGKLILLAPNRVFLQENNVTKIINRNNIIIEFLDSNRTKT